MPDFLFTEFASQNINSGTKIVQTSGRDVIGRAPGRYIADPLATAALMAAHPRLVARSSNNRYFRAMPEAGGLAVELAGAKADAVTDDGPAIRAARAYAEAMGIDRVDHQAVTYRVERIPPNERIFTTNPPIQLLPPSGGTLNYSGARYLRQFGGRGLVFHPADIGPIVDFPLAEDVAVGARQVRLQPGAGAGLAIGDDLLWQLGELPYDLPETPNWDFAQVKAVSGDLITLDKPIPVSVTLADISGPNKRLRKLAILQDCTISDLTLAGADVEDGIELTCARRIQIERVGGHMLGAGVVVAHYCDGLSITDCWQDGSSMAQPSFGAAFSFAETRNCVVTRPRARGTTGLVKAEAGAEVTVIGGCFENTILDAGGDSRGNQVTVITAVGSSTVTVNDLTVSGFGGYRLAETSNGQTGYEGSVVLSGTTKLKHPTAPYSIPLDALTGILDVTIGDLREVYNFARLRPWRRRFALRDGEYLYAYGPPGLLARARAYATPGLTMGPGGRLTGLYLGRNGDNGTNVTDGTATGLQPGKDAIIPCFAGMVGGVQWTLRHEPLALLCITATNAGLDAANEFVEFEGWLAEPTGSGSMVAEAIYRSQGSDRDPHEALFRSYDLPAVAPGAAIVVELPIADMTADDFIDAVRITGGFAGLELRGAEPRNGAIALTIANPTALPIDRAAADLGIAFTKPISGS